MGFKSMTRIAEVMNPVETSKNVSGLSEQLL